MQQVQVMHLNSTVALAASVDPCSVGPGGHFLSLHIPEPPAQARPYKGGLEVPGLFCSTRWLPSRHQPSSVSRAQRSFPISSMDRINPLELMRLAIQKALPNITVESVSPLPSCRLLRFFNVKISDGRTLVLSLPPPPTLRLLRSERGLNLSETLVTKWVLEAVLEPPIKAENITRRNISSDKHAQGTSVKDELESSFEREINLRRDVLKYLPVLVTHVPSSTELGSPFNIFEPARGVTIRELPTPLTPSERNRIDFQKGQLVQQLSSFVSPDGLFGPATAVISPQPPSTDLHAAQLANLGLRNSRTWKQTFHSLLEGVLRDAEDMAVTISYEPIRSYFNRLGHLLDGVTTARLVILDAADDLNILVSRTLNPGISKDENNKQLIHTQDIKQYKTEDIFEKTTPEQTPGGTGKGIEPPPDANHHPITVTGLRDWSNSIFGDPLFSEIFSQDPTPDFLRGFHHPSHSNLNLNLIDDPASASARLLLYECYHATVGVVQQFYRPGPSSSDREIAARRRLAAALKHLDDVDDEIVGKRARRPSANVEAWPVKRSRGEEGGEGVGVGKGDGGTERGRIKEEEEGGEEERQKEKEREKGKVYQSIEKDEDIRGP
ncbi:hypothetical protein F4813DRAFT_145830 [Daldinia decipiens]|uniref:uncharacterized protein n=1 Tax=Daldinia decipiens TaxID=326647 RepID=UPI0020C2B696|nr:uncharacterized protein F4813DRAFT_145830 [Daldinia decipiens]KAI1656119.1 hypothetical protein F4813DRAFT_145830 [Daldinia decipiens]